MLLVIKFGGTSVDGPTRMRSVASLIKNILAQGHRVVIVTSAMAGVTNRLVALLETKTPTSADAEGAIAQFFHATRKLEQEHLQTARTAIQNAGLVEEVVRLLNTERQGLDRVLLGSHLLGELTTIGSDFIVSGGERLAVPILTNCLRDHGVSAVGLGGDEAGIRTDNNYGNALPLESETREAVRSALLPLLEKGQTPVVAGFYGRSRQGRLAILGRGGSDFTATMLGASLDADEVWIMKDVDGIKSTDPRLVPTAYTIPQLTYEIAAEMALLGAKVLHPKSVQPVARRRIPLRIASSFEPEKPGSRLVAMEASREPSVTALTLVRKGGLIRTLPTEFGEEGGIPPALLEAFRCSNVDILASAAGMNGASVLWLLGPQEVDRFLKVLQEHADGRLRWELQRGVAVLGIVGERVATAVGVLARVARCLEKAQMDPLAVIQGASANGIAIALPDDEQRLSATLELLHTELILNR